MLDRPADLSETIEDRGPHVAEPLLVSQFTPRGRAGDS